MVAGIDGCRAGWIVFLSDPDGDGLNGPSYRILRDREGLRDVIISCRHVFIDIPVGLNDHGYRICDLELREALPGPKKASVFLTPVRAAVYASDYRSACDLNRKAAGAGISIQAWNIVPRIRQLDMLLSGEPAQVPNVLECHPEWQFLVASRVLAVTSDGAAGSEMPEPDETVETGDPSASNKRMPSSGSTPASPLLLPSKKTAEGINARLELLTRMDPSYRTSFDTVMQAEKRADVKPDDILDALILFHAARRFAEGAPLKTFPAERLADPNGLPVNIHYVESISGQ